MPSGREREYPMACKGGTVEVTGVNPEALLRVVEESNEGVGAPELAFWSPYVSVWAFLTPKQLGSSHLRAKAWI